MFNNFCDNKVTIGMDAEDFKKISQIDLSRDILELLIYV